MTNKKEYISPIVLAATDLFDIKAKAVENSLNKQDEVGIFELVDETWKKTYPRELEKFMVRVAKVREKDFWVTVGSKTDPLKDALWLKNGKIIMIDTGSCPTPMLGTHVYHYSKRTNEYVLLWALPDAFRLRIVKDNLIEMYPFMRDIIECIHQYEDGTLMDISNKMNGIDPNKPKDNRIIKLNDAAIETDTVLKPKDKDERHNRTNIS